MGFTSDTFEDQLLLARTEDAVRLAEHRSYPVFIGFLDQRQQQLVEALVRRQAASFRFWGGYPDSERRLLGVFPSFMEPEEAAFPLLPLGFRYRREAALTHRDFLGTLMATGIKRETVGDILCGDGLAVVFVREEIASFLATQVDKVGGEGVTVVLPYTGELPAHHQFQEITGTVASERLDALVKLCIGSGREQAARLIKAGQCSLNHQVCLSVSASVREGDILSIRGRGRFRIARLGPQTSKGRLFVTVQKYL